MRKSCNRASFPSYVAMSIMHRLRYITVSRQYKIKNARSIFTSVFATRINQHDKLDRFDKVDQTDKLESRATSSIEDIRE